MENLKGHVCLVTGASRGVGRGIALGLGERGATVYITGRTLKPGQSSEIGGSLQETAAAINASGGKAIPVVVDHSDDKQVSELFDRIRREQKGRLDVLVNNAFGGAPMMMNNLGKPCYAIEDQSPAEAWDAINNVGLRNHYICSVYAVRMMMEYQEQQKKEMKSPLHPGLIVNISSCGAVAYCFSTLYGICATALDRMTKDMAHELKQQRAQISIVSLWPGAVMTERTIKAAEESKDINSPSLALIKAGSAETPLLCGRVVAALAEEQTNKLMKRSGRAVIVSDVAYEYGIRQPDGSVPPHSRSLKYMLQMGGFSMARFVPSFVHVPKCLYVHLIKWIPAN
ncbi:unnamed protein product [Calicophoron daubneyi]|uniref:Dehydrogenase/reductase SDR family member 1 n=1 Tax=Calicophoron daubneyi TaxID=300641 RepID=A0AAV2T8E5_CALDB